MEFNLSPRQSDAWKVLDADDTGSLLYGGAKGGGKSVFGCIWTFSKCIEIIKDFKLKKSKYPPPVAFMGRKQSIDFNDTTLETWKTFIPQEYYTIRPADKEIIIADAVKINYGGFDSKDSVNKFNSAEYGIGFIDQAEELSRDDYGLFKGSFRRKIDGNELKYKILLTANPADCWLKDEFVFGDIPGNKFVKALPSDNPFLPSNYIETLNSAFKHRPELIDAYVHGRWDVLAGFDLIIKPGWVSNAFEKQLTNMYEKRIVVCDPARFGNDETVIYVMKNEQIIDQLIYGDKDTMYTAGQLQRLKEKYNCQMIAVDGIGIGSGIVDRLREVHQPVLDINSGSRPTSDSLCEKYFNRRAEMWWEAGELFADEKVSLPRDDKLSRQLMSVKYSITSNGKIKVEGKDDIKDRLGGSSPDRADCFVMGLHTLKFVPTKKHDFKRRAINKRTGYGWNPEPSTIFGRFR